MKAEDLPLLKCPDCERMIQCWVKRDVWPYHTRTNQAEGDTNICPKSGTPLDAPQGSSTGGGA